MKKITNIITFLVLIIIVGGVNVYATSIGEQLTKPEKGWKRYDDSNNKFKYLGNWDIENYENHYNKADHLTTTDESNKITFKFKGSDLRLISDINYNHCKQVTIKIDGTINDLYSQYIEVGIPQVLIYEINGLTDEEHIVEIAGSDEGIFSLDAIDINEAGYLMDIYKPQNIIAKSSATNITLNWDSVDNADSYTILRSTISTSLTEVLALNIKDTTYIDNDVEPGVTYYYAIRSVKDSLNNEMSNIVSAKINITDEILELKSIDEIKIGEKITIDAILHNAKKIYAEDFTITYDSDVFEYLGYEEIEGLKVVKPLNTEGILRFIIASKGKDKSVDGSEIIAKLKFRAIKTGVSNIKVTKARIANIEREWDLKTKNIKNKIITITGFLDVNKTNDFTLVDLAIDGYYYNVSANSTDKDKYNADIIIDGTIDEKDLSAIVDEILANPSYTPNK